MKIKKEHYKEMETVIHTFQQNNPKLKREYMDAGFSGMRYRWDVLHACGLTGWICNNLYAYLNDDHIDTALRKITKTN